MISVSSKAKDFRLTTNKTTEDDFYQGKRLIQEGKLDEAMTVISQFIKLNPEHIPAHFQLAKIYESKKQFDQVLSHYQQIVNLEPDNMTGITKLAKAMMRQGDLDGAITNYQRVILQDSEQPAWIYGALGDALNQKGQIDAAISAYQKTIELKSDNPGWYLMQARLYGKKGLWDLAIDCYQEAIKLKPEKLGYVYIELGDAFNNDKQLKNAIAAYQKATDINPNNKIIYTKLQAKLADVRQRAIPLEDKNQQKTDLKIQDWPQTLSQMGQDYWVINEAFGGKEKGYFLEIGSADGITINNTYLLEKRYGWSGICVEPNPSSFAQLKLNRNCICSNVCIDEKKGEVEFVLDNLMGGILDKDTDNYRRIEKNKNLADKITTIKTIPLIKLLKQHKAPKTIDYFSLDVEGAETRILQNFPFKEYIFLTITIERPSQVLQNILLRNNYILVKTIPGFDSFFIHKSFQKDYRSNLMNFYQSRN